MDCSSTPLLDGRTPCKNDAGVSFSLTLNARDVPRNVFCRNNGTSCLKSRDMRGFVTACVVKWDVTLGKSVEKCPFLRCAAWRLRDLSAKNLAQTQFSGRNGPFPCSKYFSADPADRFIDGYQSRNEKLADLMRRMGICEEKGSGIDKVIQTVEVYQLPAPEFISSYNRTVVKIFGHIPFEDMTRDDRIRACYQHACLKFVMNEQMTNQTLRKRFELPESKSATVSQVLALALEAGKIKTDYTMGGSRKFARYLPIWA